MVIGRFLRTACDLQSCQLCPEQEMTKLPFRDNQDPEQTPLGLLIVPVLESWPQHCKEGRRFSEIVPCLLIVSLTRPCSVQKE
jgi:hypothetical protein